MRMLLLLAPAMLPLTLLGCGHEKPAAPPPPPATRLAQPVPAPATGPAETPNNLIQVSARIVPSAAAGAFPKDLIIDLAVPANLHWNNEARPVTLTLSAPAGVRLAKTSVEIPNPSEPTDTKPRSVTVGLSEDPAAGKDWPLTVNLIAFVCYDVGGICLRQEERHIVTPKRGT